MSFPRMLYHPRIGAVVVNDDTELRVLSKDWADKPFTDTSNVCPQVVAFGDLPEDGKHKAKAKASPQAGPVMADQLSQI